MDRMSRRRFLRAAAAGGLLYAFGRTPGTVTAHAAGLGGFSDYKALVCVFLFGGNDSWSMVVPRSSAEYDTYAASRRNLAIARDTSAADHAARRDRLRHAPVDAGPRQLVRVRALRRRGERRPAHRADESRPVSEQGCAAAAATFFAQRSTDAMAHAARSAAVQDGLGRACGRRTRGRPVRPATGDECLVVGDHLVPGGHVGSTVRDGGSRSTGVQVVRYHNLAEGETRCV